MYDGSKLKSTSWAAQEVGEIEELVLQILHRLPLKSLGKFKSVSKQWLSLVITCSKNPRPERALLLQYSNRSETTYSPDLHLLPLQLNNNDDAQAAYTLRLQNDDNKCRFACLRSCNGLLLLSADGYYTVGVDYYVYNPVTRQRADLPELDCHSHVAASLAYEPSKSPHYRVVCLCKISTDDENVLVRGIMIYSSETRCWRRWDDSSFEPGLGEVGKCSVNAVDSGLYWNGSVYYVSHGRDTACKLHRFDTESETMERAHLPPDCETNINNESGSNNLVKYLRLRASWGRLYLVVAGSTRGEQYNVYEMEKNEWRVKYDLNSSFDWGTIRDSFRVWLPACKHNQLFFSPAGEDGEDEVWVVHKKQKLVLRCNMRSRNVHVVRDKRESTAQWRRLRGHEFTQSILIGPPMINFRKPKQNKGFSFIIHEIYVLNLP